MSWCFAFLLHFFLFFSFKGQRILFNFWYFFQKKQSLLSLLFCRTSNSYVMCECFVWCMMCDVPDLNFVRSWLFELMGDLKCTIFCCFARPPMELMVNSKHRFCRLVTSFFKLVHSRAVGKLMYSLLYFAWSSRWSLTVQFMQIKQNYLQFKQCFLLY